MLRKELEHHLHLQSHVEVRPYDVFVLRLRGNPASPVPRGVPAIRIGKDRVQFHNAQMTHITDALQYVLGRPVLDKTGLSERYDFEVTWASTPLADVTATLRDRFGLDLVPARVDMDTLVIDRVRRDPALFLLGEVGRLGRFVPAALRNHLADLTID